MKVITHLLLVVLFVGCSTSITKDYRKILDIQEKQQQTELDKGKRMMSVEQQYEVTMDSMLNLVYKDLMHRLSDSEKNKLRTEQREWIKNRDVVFKEYSKPLKEMEEEYGMVPMDERMFLYSKRASFIKKRVLELIDKLDE